MTKPIQTITGMAFSAEHARRLIKALKRAVRELESEVSE